MDFSNRQRSREVDRSHHWANMPFEDQPWKFFKVWPQIVLSASKCRDKPKVFEVSGGASMKVEALGLTASIS